MRALFSRILYTFQVMVFITQYTGIWVCVCVCVNERECWYLFAAWTWYRHLSSMRLNSTCNSACVYLIFEAFSILAKLHVVGWCNAHIHHTTLTSDPYATVSLMQSFKGAINNNCCYVSWKQEPIYPQCYNAKPQNVSIKIEHGKAFANIKQKRKNQNCKNDTALLGHCEFVLCDAVPVRCLRNAGIHLN